MGFALAKERLLTVEEYLAFEEKSRIKHEYMDGEIFAMAGSKRSHSLVTTNISTDLNIQLREGDCEVHQSDFRVSARGDHYVYPDVVVACGEIETTGKEIETLLNPIVIVEVLSKSTEKRDRGDKAADYFALRSLREYVLVAQDKVRVEHFARQSNNQWKLTIYTDLIDILVLDSINCQVSLKSIYAKVKFPLLKIVKSKNGR